MEKEEIKVLEGYRKVTKIKRVCDKYLAMVEGGLMSPDTAIKEIKEFIAGE